MTKTMITRPLLALAGLLFLHQGIACTDDEPDDDLWTELDCADYCDRANECDGTDVSECEDDCLSALANCQADEREAAQNQLEDCAEVACDEFTECTIEAGAQCFFGI